MSETASTGQTFDGLNYIPHEAGHLRHHLSRLKQRLETTYIIPADQVELALRADASADFLRFYQAEVQRIVAHLNRSTRAAIKVRVEPSRLAKGFEMAGQEPSAQLIRSDCTPLVPRRGDASRSPAAMKANSSSSASRAPDVYRDGDASRNKLTGASSAAAGGTPSAAPKSGARVPAYHYDSAAKAPRSDSFCIFDTPPVLKDFDCPLATPSSEDVSPSSY